MPRSSNSSTDRPRRVTTSCQGDVVTLRMVRPERHNAIDFGFAEDVAHAADECAQLVHEGAACVVLAADGTNFCVGGDITDFPDGPEEATVHISRMAALVHGAFATLWELPVPIVAAVQGAAAGAGIGLALLGDIVVAADTVRFRSSYTAVGLSPDCGVSWLLPRVAGERLALDMVLTNRTVGAAESLAAGLVSRVVPADRLAEETSAVADAVVAAGDLASRTSKRLLRQAGADSLRAHLADEAASIAALAAEDHARSLRARFLSG